MLLSHRDAKTQSAQRMMGLLICSSFFEEVDEDGFAAFFEDAGHYLRMVVHAGMAQDVEYRRAAAFRV